LPGEMTHMVGPVPSEIRRQMVERDRVEEAKSKRRARLNGGVDPNAPEVKEPEAVKGPKDQLFDQIYEEILDRRQHQEAMEDTGKGKETRKAVANEISSRVKRLGELNPGRAAKVLAELYD